MKIGFIAMSGIRVYDQELFELGLTLPGVVERGNVIARLPSLGLLTLAALTPDDVDIEYFEIDDLRTTNELPQDCDLVAISSLSAQIGEAYEVAEQLRKRGTQVVMGGLHVTSVPEEAAQHCDAVVVGEGEVFWPEVVEDARRGKLRSVYEDPSRSFDLKDAPIPRYDMLDVEQYNRLTVQTSRGCPLQCEFCAGSILLTNKYKQKPIDRVLTEIDTIRSIWRRPFIELADDNSFCHKKYWLELLPELAKRSFRWFTETDISVGEDDELLELMHQAGCMEVLIGLESPDEIGLKGIELKTDWKCRQWSHYVDSVRNIQRHGIAVNGCFILGLDNHKSDVFDKVFDAAEEMELFDVQVTLQTPFPGTPLYQRLKNEGRLLEENAWHKCTLFDVLFEPKHMSPDELRNGFRQLVGRLYSPEQTQKRREIFQHKYYQPRSCSSK